jgi:hypothetical protein
MSELIRLAGILDAAHRDYCRLPAWARREERQACYWRECEALTQFEAAIHARLAS